MVVTGLGEVRAVELDVDKMPLPSASVALSGAASIRIPVFVGPHRFASDIVRGEAVRIVPKHCTQLGASPYGYPDWAIVARSAAAILASRSRRMAMVSWL